jgi:hypothetical protein
MKSFLILLIISSVLVVPALSQSNDSIYTSIEADTSYFTVGKKQVEIIERSDSTFVKVWEEKESEDKEFPSNPKLFEEDLEFGVVNTKDEYKFRGHWAGIEFGMNNYVDENFSIARTPENEFMDINTNRSWNFNLNFAQFSIPFGSSYFGAVTGMGLEWSNYHFTHTTTIVKDTEEQQIVPVVINKDLKMNRFQTTYLTVPLLLEVQFFNAPRADRMYLAAGVIGGMKLGAHTKYKYVEDGVKRSKKHRSDFYLRPFRYAVTGRVGFKMLKVYMNYYPTSLFLEGKGPELYPVAMGFCITF